MTVGILLTQFARPEQDGRFGTYADRTAAWLHESDTSLQCPIYRILEGEWPASIDSCDGWVITGSVHSAYETLDWIHTLKKFVVACDKAKKKLIGICFGHQIIAEALGGRVEKAVQGWGLGVHRFTIAKRYGWMEPAQSSLALLYSHQDQVVALPKGAVCVGGDACCPNRMYVVEDHIIGMQGHPEFNVEIARYLLDKRRDVLSVEQYTKAIQSMDTSLDNGILADWITRFLRGDAGVIAEE